MSYNLRGGLIEKTKTLRDEQERVQKKTFTNWINTYLRRTDPPSKITDLFLEIRDGIHLLHLLQILSGEKLPMEVRKTMQRVHNISNIRTALQYLEKKQVKLVNINPTDIVDGKPAIVLGLIWTIIICFQIEDQEEFLINVLGLSAEEAKIKGSGKKALLAWVEKTLADQFGEDVRDFGPSWRDGRAFNAIVHSIDPRLVDMDALNARSNRENLDNAFALAEQHLGIPKLLDAEDVDVDKPDEKSIMTYVAQFLKAYPEGKKSKDGDDAIQMTNVQPLKSQVDQADNNEIEEEIERQRQRELEQELEREKELELERQREREKELELERQREREKELELEQQREKELELERERERERERKQKELELQRERELEQKRQQEKLENDARLARVEQAQEQYTQGLDQVIGWLDDIQNLMSRPIPCSQAEMAKFIRELEQARNDQKHVEEDFATAFNASANLSKDDPNGNSAQRQQELEDIQERLAAVGKDIPEKLKVLEAVAKNAGLLEGNLSEIQEWIAKGEQLKLAAHNATDPDEVQKYARLLREHMAQADSMGKKLGDSLKLLKDMQDSRLDNLDVKNLKAGFEELEENFDNLLNAVQDQEHQEKQFQDACAKANSSLKEMDDELGALLNTTGNPEDLKSKLQQLKDLEDAREAGESQLQDAIRKAQKLLETAGPGAKEAIQAEIDALEAGWEKMLARMQEAEQKIQSGLGQWEKWNNEKKALSHWMDTIKSQLENVPQSSSAEDKLELFSKYKDLLGKIDKKADDLQAFTESTEKLEQSSGDQEPVQEADQMKSRYKQLHDQCSKIAEDCQRNANDHQHYDAVRAECQEWVKDAQKLRKQIDSKTGSKEDLAKKLEMIQDLKNKRPTGEDHIKELAQAAQKLDACTTPDGKKHIHDEIGRIKSDFDELYADLSSNERQLDDILGQMTGFEAGMGKLLNWLGDADGKLENLNDMTGDQDVLADKARKLQELSRLMAEEKARLDEVTRRAQQLLNAPGTTPEAKEEIRAQLDELEENWEKTSARLTEAQQRLHAGLGQWDNWNQQQQALAGWLAAAEREVATIPLCDSLQEKRDLLSKYEDLKATVDAKSGDLQRFVSEAGKLGAASKDQRPMSQAEKMTSRYKRLQEQSADAVETCEENIKNHHDFDASLDECHKWIDNVKKLRRKLETEPGTKDDLSKKLEIIQQLQALKPAGQDKIAELVKSAQKLNSSTSQQGLERIYGEVGQVKSDFDSVYENLSATQRKIDGVLGEMTSLDTEVDHLTDWMNESSDKLQGLSNPTGNRNNLENKLQQLKNLARQKEEQDSIVEEAISKAQQLMQSAGPGARGEIKAQLDALESGWETLGRQMGEAEQRLKAGLTQWEQWGGAGDALTQWMDGVEGAMENVQPAGDLQEKEKQLGKYEELLREIESKANEMQKFGNDTNKLAAFSKDPTLVSQAEKIKSRYRNLMEKGRETVDQCQQNIKDQKDFEDDLAECCNWIDNARKLHRKLDTEPGTKDELAKKLEIIQQLRAMKPAGQDKIAEVVKSAQKLNSSTSQEGLESIQDEIGQVKSDFNNLYENLGSAQRKIDDVLGQMSSLDDEMSRLTDWLDDTSTKLPELNDLTGNQSSLDGKLRKVKELGKQQSEQGIHYEDILRRAQQLMQSAGPAAKEATRSRLEALQSEWDKVSGSLGESEQLLQAKVGQWEKLGTDQDALLRWMTEVERAVSQIPLSDSLQDKEDMLAKLEDLKREAEGKSNSVQKCIGDTTKLAASSKDQRLSAQAEKIKSRYRSILEQCQDAVDKCQQHISDHQMFQSSLADCQEWIDSTRKIRRKADLEPETKEDLVKQLESIQRLQSMKSAGKDKIAELTKSAQKLNPSTTPQGLEQVQREMGQVKSDFDAIFENLSASQRKLEGVLDHTTSLEDEIAKLSDWLLDADDKLVELSDLSGNQAVLENKLKQLNALKRQHAEEDMHLQDVMRQAQQLMGAAGGTGKDSIRSRLAALQGDWGSLGNRLSDSQQRLQDCWEQWKEWSNEQESMSRWLDLKEREVDNIPQSNSLQEREELLSALERLTNNIERKGNDIQKFGIETNRLAVLSKDPKLNLQSDKMKLRYKNLLQKCQEAMEKQQETIRDHQDYANVLAECGGWLENTKRLRRRLDSDGTSKDDLVRKLDLIQQLQGLKPAGQEKLDDLLKSVQRLSSSTTPQGMEQIQQEVGQIRSEFDATFESLIPTQRRLIAVLDQITSLESDIQSFARWLDEAEQDLEQNRKPCDNLDEIAVKMKNLKSLIAGSQPQSRVMVTIEGKVRTLHNDLPQPDTERAVAELAHRYRGLLNEAELAHAKMDETAKLYSKFENELQNFKIWLNEAVSKSSTPLEPVGDVETLKRELAKLEVLLDDVVAHKTDLTHLTGLADDLQKLNNDRTATSKTKQVESQYNTMLQKCRDAIKQLESTAQNQKEFDKSVDDATRWIKMTTQVLMQCSESDVKPSVLQDKLRAVKGISDSLETGQLKLVSVTDIGDRLCQQLGPGRGTDRVRNQVADLKSTWSELMRQVGHVQTNLEKAAAKWCEYEELADKLQRWLEDTERSADRLADYVGGPGQRKSQLDELKALRKEIDRYGNDFRILQSLMDDLSVTNLDSSLTSLPEQYRLLSDKVTNLLETLNKVQQVLEGYQESLKNCEKWIMSTNFRLMNENTAFCQSLEEAQKLAEQHAVLMNEISGMRKTIYNTIGMGRRLMDDSRQQSPETEAEIEDQIENLEHNYESQLMTAENIRNRLEENLKRWRAYQDTVTAADRFLNNQLPAWWADKERFQPQNLEEAVLQLNNTREMISKVNQMRQGVCSAGHRCEAYTNLPDKQMKQDEFGRFDLLTPTSSPSESRTKPEPLRDSALHRLADKVLRQIDHHFDKLELELGRSHQSISAWERFVRLRDDFCNWLEGKQIAVRHLLETKERSSQPDNTELRALEDFLSDLKERDPTIASLTEQHAALVQSHPGTVDPVLQRAKTDYDCLIQEVQRRLRKKDKMIEVNVDLEEPIGKTLNRDVATAPPMSPSKLTQSTQTANNQTTQTNNALLLAPLSGVSSRHRSLSPPSPALPASLSVAPASTAGVESEFGLRNSGGNRGISKQFWPYDFSGKVETDGLLYRSDSLLDSVPSRDEFAGQTPSNKRIQTAYPMISETSQTKIPQNRTKSIKELLRTVRHIKENLARSGDTAPTVRPLSVHSTPRLTSMTPIQTRSPETESIRRNVGLPPFGVPSLSPSLPSHRPRSVSPGGHRQMNGEKAENEDMSGRRSRDGVVGHPMQQQYALDRETLDQHIPTRPHWKSGPLLYPQPPYPPPSPQISAPQPPPIPVDIPYLPEPYPLTTVRDLVCNYDHMLLDNGNVKQERPPKHHSGRRSHRSGSLSSTRRLLESLDKAARTADDLRGISEKLSRFN